MLSSDWASSLYKSLNKSTYYFCISESTKIDFYRLFPNEIDKNKMFVTYIATAQFFLPNYDKNILNNILKNYNINIKPDDLYIYSLCSIDPRKNLLFTVKCFIKFLKKNNVDNFYFFLGGAYLPVYLEEFEKNMSELSDYQNKIIRLGYIDDIDLNILYSNSLFFTYLSQYEGFGMPPLEAMQAGTPVICSNNSSLPEVVGDAAITINYNDEEACIKAMEDLYFNENLRKEYVRKGLERAKLFSWEKTFNTMSNVIQNAVSNI
jgi:glycosyltransferase involved in cell wall biosynthesis